MEDEIELTEIEQKIFDKVKKYYAQKNAKITDENFLKKTIKSANTHGDGKKRVCKLGNGKTYLVPIEDFFTKTVREQELDKYTKEK